MKKNCCSIIALALIFSQLISFTIQAKFQVNSELFKYESKLFGGLANFAESTFNEKSTRSNQNK
jgi:hypothetical protein